MAPCGWWDLYPHKHNCSCLVRTYPPSSLSSMPNKFEFEGWNSSNGAFYHPEQGWSLLSPLEPGSPAPRCPGSQVRSALRQIFSNLFVIFPLALFMKAACRNALALITTRFLSVLFPDGCFTLTDQIKTRNRGGGHLALVAEHHQEEKLLEIKSFFFPSL